MRRLLLLLLALFSLGTVLPSVPARAMHMGMPAGHCPDQPGMADHGCLGCAVQPDATIPTGPAPRSPASLPAPLRTALLSDHRDQADPPPPRARA